MAYFRHAARHLQRSVEDRVKFSLEDAGWFSNPAPFRASPVQLILRRLEESEMRAVRGNMVAVVFGDETTDTEIELGGGLKRFYMIVWVDVVADSDALAVAISSDILDACTGRNPAYSPWLEVRDYTRFQDGEPVPGWRAEFIRAERVKPDATEWRRFWTSLSLQVEVTYAP